MSSRRASSVALAIALLAVVAATAPGEARSQLAERAPARLQVGADEFRYTLSRLRLRAGRAVVQLVNYGEDDHNLRLRRVGATYTHRVARTTPGGMTELRAKLRVGGFKLWCSLPGHEAAGMSASLRVYKPA